MTKESNIVAVEATENSTVINEEATMTSSSENKKVMDKKITFKSLADINMKSEGHFAETGKVPTIDENAVRTISHNLEMAPKEVTLRITENYHTLVIKVTCKFFSGITESVYTSADIELVDAVIASMLQKHEALSNYDVADRAPWVAEEGEDIRCMIIKELFDKKCPQAYDKHKMIEGIDCTTFTFFLDMNRKIVITEESSKLKDLLESFKNPGYRRA